MEGPVKERLTGALILIAALIVVVPEMLTGPDDNQPARSEEAEAGPPLRTYQLQLDTPSAERSEDQSALSPRSAPVEPAAASSVAPPAVEASAPAAAPAQQAVTVQQDQEKPVAEKPAAQKPPAPAAASSGNWWTQLGSFSARDNADRLARQLRAAGYQISVSPSKSNGKELFRVRAGPVPTREAAVALQSRLAAAGHKSTLVAP